MSLPQETRRRIAAMLHHRTGVLGNGDAVPEPLIPTSIYQLPDEPAADRTYGRVANPTVQAAEQRLSVLEAAPTLLFSSGMAAYSALFHALLKAGDRVLLLSDGYYAVRSYADEFLSGYGVSVENCPAAKVIDQDLSGFKLAIIETPANPGLDIIDIRRMAEKAQAAGCRLAVDNSVCTPLLQQPLDLGADIVLSADTKATGGHSDLLLGHISSRDDALMERVHTARTLGGAIASPFDAWLLVRGLETLDVRLERMCENAKAVAEQLAGHPSVIGLRVPPADLAQMANSGYLIGVEFADKSTAERFIDGSGVFVAATSFGGLHSSADRRQRWGDEVSDGFLRLSIGCEPRDLLIEATVRALDGLS